MSHAPRTARRALAALVRVTLPLLVALLLPLLTVGAVVASRWSDATRAPALAPVTLPDLPPPPTRRTAVVVTGNGGAEMTDFLIPYEVLGATGRFDLSVVAPTRALVPLASASQLDGGLDLVPHYSLDEYDRRGGRAPDVIVIPFLPAFGRGGERALVPWVRAQAARGALVVSICAGAEVLAATGLVDGERATTHPMYLERFEREYPRVRWVRDVRYVESARAIASGAIASGMDAMLAAVRRTLGRAEAERVAARLAYPHVRFLDAPAFRARLTDPWALARGALSPRRTLAVALYDGVSETHLGSLFDTYPLTTGYRLVSLAERRALVRSRHGMLLVPRRGLDAAGAVDGVLLPGAPDSNAAAPFVAWSRARARELTDVHRRGGFAYDGALRDLARRDGALAARGVARALDYPTTHLALEAPPLTPWSASALAALAAAGFVLARALVRRREEPPRAPLRPMRPAGERGLAA